MRISLAAPFITLMLISTLFLHADINNVNLHIADFSQDFPNNNQLCHNCHTGNSYDVNVTAVSYVCLDCHNGVMTDSVRDTYCDTSTNAVNRSQHPVFVNYMDGGSSSLKPIESALNGEWNKAEKISDLLENGQLLCTSCHQAHKGKIRTVNGLTTLCRGCHIK